MTKLTKRLISTERAIEKTVGRGERRTLALAKGIVSHKRFSRFLRVLGPGLVTGAADDDPAGIVTYTQAGASFGYGLLWSFPLMYPLLLVVQSTCARIGAITGKGLAAVIKDNYNSRMLYGAVLLVVIANTINIGADLGAMAATTQLFVSLPFELLAIFYAVVITALVVFVRYKTYAKILKWLAVALFAYPIAALLIGQDWSLVIKNTLRPSIEFSAATLYMLVAMIGTTISPYLFFWDTSEVVEEEFAKKNIAKIGKDESVTKKFLRNIRIDNFVGMTLASVTAWFIVVACASTLHVHGVTNIQNAADAARSLEPLVQGFPNAGLVAKLIFSVGIIGLGLLAVPVLAGSSSYAISEVFGWREGLHNKFKRAAGFYGVIILATCAGLAINLLGIDPIKALIFSAVFNGVAAIPLLLIIARIGRSEKIMGQYKNSVLSDTVIKFTFLVMLLATLGMLYTVIT